MLTKRRGRRGKSKDILSICMKNESEAKSRTCSVRWRLGQDKVVSPLVDPIRRRLRLLHNAVTKRVGDSIYSKD